MIFDGRACAPVVLDAASEERSYVQVLRAAGDLRQDIAMVTGAVPWACVRDLMVDSPEARDERLATAMANKPALVPALVRGAEELAAAALRAGGELPYAVIVGRAGHSALLDQVLATGAFPEAQALAGTYERYAVKEVARPLPGVARALVVAGSDARGTIFGIYRVSQLVGVSPYYWMSDVPVVVRERIDVAPALAAEPAGVLAVEEPKVRYRGLFLNDEDISIAHWATRKFPTCNGTPDVNYYRHVFEVALRLGLNTLWPAMHPVSTAFNMAVDEAGVPINAREAARYGVVIGTSHCENMLRTNTREWAPWYEAHRDMCHATKLVEADSRDENLSLETDLAFDFTLNREAVLAYWKERLEANRDFESVLTLGIRGIHDGGFHCARLDRYPGATDMERKVAFMADVIESQRQIIDEVWGEGACHRVPQALIVYKEVADVYNAGLDKIMAQPEYADVMLMWAEDNYGHLRQYPNELEMERPGGAGVYYHSSYLGSPRSYLWLNSVHLPLMVEQLQRAYRAGLRSYWIMNVGDLKPGEVPLELFSRLAWDPEATGLETVVPFLREQGARDYRLDVAAARQYADAVNEYSRLVGIKRAEFFCTAYHEFDLAVNAGEAGDEAGVLVSRAEEVAERIAELYDSLDADTADALYEMAYYHVLSFLDAATEYYHYWRNRLAAAQGRYAAARAHAALSQRSARAIEARMYDFNGIHDGKWCGFMDWRSVDYRPLIDEDWNHDIVQVDEYDYCEAGVGVGAACEGCAAAGVGTLRLSAQVPGDTRFIEVFTRNAAPATWMASCSPWLRLSEEQGIVATEDCIGVTCDWDALADSDAPRDAAGRVTGEVCVLDGASGEEVAAFGVVCDPRVVAAKAGKAGFVEADGVLVVEAEDFARALAGTDGSSWAVLPDDGMHGAMVKALPDLGRSAAGEGARIAYDVYVHEAGTYAATLECGLTLSEGKDADGTPRSCDVAVYVNEAEPQVLVGEPEWIAQADNDLVIADMSNPWVVNLLRGREKRPFTFEACAGWNSIEVERRDPSVTVDRIVVETQPGALAPSLLGPVESQRVGA